jgi:hypothetical protein
MTILGSVVLAAAMAAPEAATVAARGRVCGGIVVSSPDRVRSRSASFSAHKTLDLVFRMQLRKAETPQLITFRVFTPKGHLYQEIQALPSSAAGRSASSVEARLPLAGTAIATSSLYGRWKVVPHLDDNPVGCAAGSVFTIAK